MRTAKPFRLAFELRKAGSLTSPTKYYCLCPRSTTAIVHEVLLPLPVKYYCLCPRSTTAFVHEVLLPLSTKYYFTGCRFCFPASGWPEHAACLEVLIRAPFPVSVKAQSGDTGECGGSWAKLFPGFLVSRAFPAIPLSGSGCRWGRAECGLAVQSS